MKMMTLDEHVNQLKKVCNQLIPYSIPKGTIEDELDLLPLKSGVIVVDGYDISVNLSISDYEKYSTETIQIQGLFTPFLPFFLVCKIAKAFLGEENLSYAEFIRNNRRIYSWIVRKRGNKILKPAGKVSWDEYDGFKYAITNPGFANLYDLA